MIMRSIHKAMLILLCYLFVFASVFAETIRGPVVDTIVIEGEAGFKKQIALTASDLVILSLGDNRRFLKGLQLEISLSDILKRYSDCFALEIYHTVTPEPGSGSVEYTGRRVFFEVLPVFNKVYVNIPMGKNNNNTGYLPPDRFVLTSGILEKNFPLLISIQTVMKGVPDSVLEKSFYIGLEPELEKKGVLQLTLKKPAGFEQEGYEVMVDDIVLENIESEYVFDTGIHSLRVRSVSFKEENTSFSIEAGKTTRVELVLQRSKPLLTIDMIEGTSFYLDGEKLNLVSGEEMVINEGTHTVVIKIGNQTITKKIDVLSGKRYNISLIFDIKVKED
jgi:hypothetical protein